jgi:flagellar biosynthetic protein FliR
MLQLYPQQVLAFAFILMRLGGLVLMAPFFGARHVPWQVRGLLAVAVALMVTAVCDAQPLAVLMEDPWECTAAACRETVLGLVLGTAMMLMVGGLRAAGQLIGQMSGMSLAEAVNADGGEASTGYGRLFELTGIAAFLLIGGHRQVMSALLDSFQWMPPGRVGFDGGLLAILQEIASRSFELALRSCAPVLVALLIAALVMGAVHRLVPQFNTLSLGFSLNVIAAMALVALTLGSVTWIFQSQVEDAVALVYQAMQAATPPAP